jgi:hypothetical protein
MSQPLERMAPSPVAWCGRSWQGLVDRRTEAFQHASVLTASSDGDSYRVVRAFIAFFDHTGTGLFRDEEEWIFRTLRPTPRVVLDARQDHIEIASLTRALLDEAQAGCVDLRVVHRLGTQLEEHLVLEEHKIRPLFHRTSLLPPMSQAQPRG